MSLSKLKQLKGFIFFSLVFIYLTGCSNEPSVTDQLLGQWRFERHKVHTILSFRTNGTWTAQVRTEGRLQKIVGKKGNVIGNYNANETQLEMTPTTVPVDIGWQKDQTVLFTITELTGTTLGLRAPTGEEKLFKRVKSQKQGQENTQQTIKLDPIVVNVSQGEVLRKDRYLCLYIELIQDTPNDSHQLHPKVRDALIMHLSSLTYPEVNSYRKLHNMRSELIDLINPYMGCTLTDIAIKNAVVTADQNAVNEFLALFESHKEEEDGEKELQN
jgi:flagellar basal body-associated protein FliL